MNKKSETGFGTIEQAIADVGAGKMILVADDVDRENEGDLICAASLVTPELINNCGCRNRATRIQKSSALHSL